MRGHHGISESAIYREGSGARAFSSLPKQNGIDGVAARPPGHDPSSRAATMPESGLVSAVIPPSMQAMPGTSRSQIMRFSQCFRRAVIELDPEQYHGDADLGTVEWNRSSTEDKNVDGIELNRSGDTDCNVRIFLFPDFQGDERVRISRHLQACCGSEFLYQVSSNGAPSATSPDVSRYDRPAVFATKHEIALGILDYAKRNELFQSGRQVHLDAQLRALLEDVPDEWVCAVLGIQGDSHRKPDFHVGVAAAAQRETARDAGARECNLTSAGQRVAYEKERSEKVDVALSGGNLGDRLEQSAQDHQLPSVTSKPDMNESSVDRAKNARDTGSEPASEAGDKLADSAPGHEVLNERMPSHGERVTAGENLADHVPLHKSSDGAKQSPDKRLGASDPSSDQAYSQEGAGGLEGKEEPAQAPAQSADRRGEIKTLSVERLLELTGYHTYPVEPLEIPFRILVNPESEGKCFKAVDVEIELPDDATFVAGGGGTSDQQKSFYGLEAVAPLGAEAVQVKQLEVIEMLGAHKFQHDLLTHFASNVQRTLNDMILYPARYRKTTVLDGDPKNSADNPYSSAFFKQLWVYDAVPRYTLKRAISELQREEDTAREQREKHELVPDARALNFLWSDQ
ncbi:hypothetical protein FVE85_8073 [Porphyridium purpureum]|uniref:Uncharacterized protein n=1 Tax=Porphyridium purpureum TaxID=35688 RepID=A0A5J4YMA8_PORPP|nr:hypothetical protein FVE85_8073 [Porphyridium purpureum]|eukprot:POR8626..scf295_9